MMIHQTQWDWLADDLNHTQELSFAVSLHAEDLIMLACPFCEKELRVKTSDGWACQCGETIPFGMERDDGENCASCPNRNCPRRK
jgi:hypothetical protein